MFTSLLVDKICEYDTCTTELFGVRNLTKYCNTHKVIRNREVSAVRCTNKRFERAKSKCRLFCFNCSIEINGRNFKFCGNQCKFKYINKQRVYVRKIGAEIRQHKFYIKMLQQKQKQVSHTNLFSEN